MTAPLAPFQLNPNGPDWHENPAVDPGHTHTGGSGGPATTVTGPDDAGDLAVVGTSINFAREDHDHGFPTLTVTAITGALSTVTDTAAKAVLTSIIGACVAGGIATNGTT